ncbi:transcription factor E2F wHTH only [Cryptosporidium sp. chipmunk genotype I]|uniref:transcription factor E2F wHTH only n=1 Tax=Cryptosporidium sp. chipmunk genotype I TaxID=1280935 RepID=UPI00351A9407|nr:transcription factor E2F wHTH only [Cryptosporidium sp. chipmunk genotype I]
MTNEVPYNLQMMGTSSTSTNSGNSGDIVSGINAEIIHDGTGGCNNNAGSNTQDVLSLLSYLVPNSGGDVNCSSVNPPPQIADPVTINELLGLINGAVSSNSNGIKGGASNASNSCEPNNLIDTANNGNMASSIPYLLPLLMGSGSNNDQNITLLNSLVSSTGNSNGTQGNINQFVSQLQNLLPPIVPGPNSGNIQNNQNLSHSNSGSNHSAEHLQMIYGGGNNISADNKSELLAAAAAFAASNTMNISSTGPVTNSRGRARKRTSTTPLGGMRGRRDSTDANKRRGGSPGRHHTMDGTGMPASGALLPHIPSLGSDGIETLEHSGGVSMLGTPAAHHNGSQYNEFSTEDARHSVRFENGLVLMTKRFIQYLYEQGESRIIDLAAAEAHMDVQRRRLYDITNVLEGIGILKKMGRNAFMCSASVPEVLVERDAVLSSFGTVDMSVKLAPSIDDETLDAIPWFCSYNKLQVLSNSEYEVMEKTLIQRKEQLLQACQQLGFTDIVDQYTIATNSAGAHVTGGAVANYTASVHANRPQSHTGGASTSRTTATGQHSTLSISHTSHAIREDNISVPNTIEQQPNEANSTSNSNTGALWGSIMGGSNRTSTVPSIHHPDARWMETAETNHGTAKHRMDGDQNSGSGVVGQNENIGGFTE